MQTDREQLNQLNLPHAENERRFVEVRERITSPTSGLGINQEKGVRFDQAEGQVLPLRARNRASSWPVGSSEILSFTGVLPQEALSSGHAWVIGVNIGPTPLVLGDVALQDARSSSDQWNTRLGKSQDWSASLSPEIVLHEAESSLMDIQRMGEPSTLARVIKNLLDRDMLLEAGAVLEKIPQRVFAPEQLEVFRSALVSSNQAIEKEIIDELGIFSSEDLEDGMTAALGERLAAILNKHGVAAIPALDSIISSGILPVSLISHALRWLGRLKHPETFHGRLEFLLEFLSSENPSIRDSAALGLASLGSKAALPELRRAAETERLLGLRADLFQLVRKLESKVSAGTSSQDG